MMTDVQDRKKQLREQAHANRNAQPDKDVLSQRICATFAALPEYTAAKTVLFYVDVRSEVRTRHYLATALTHGKKIVVPWCNEHRELALRLCQRGMSMAGTKARTYHMTHRSGWRDPLKETDWEDVFFAAHPTAEVAPLPTWFVVLPATPWYHSNVEVWSAETLNVAVWP